MLKAGIVSSTHEIEQILALQQIYLRGKKSATEEKDQGFLTVKHTFDALQQMHNREPSVIVKHHDRVIAYALTMPSACRHLVPVLVPMFDHFDSFFFDNRLISSYNYYVMGQICVDKAYRGKGVFDLLYATHKGFFGKKYDFTITEVSLSNTRSMRAHERVGFMNISEFEDVTDKWAVMLWDWR